MLVLIKKFLYLRRNDGLLRSYFVTIVILLQSYRFLLEAALFCEAEIFIKDTLKANFWKRIMLFYTMALSRFSNLFYVFIYTCVLLTDIFNGFSLVQLKK